MPRRGLFRLRSFVIELPPLRERTGDVQEIALHHLSRVCDRLNIGLKGLAPELLEALMHYRWPGNVRELLHALERAEGLCPVWSLQITPVR